MFPVRAESKKKVGRAANGIAAIEQQHDKRQRPSGGQPLSAALAKCNWRCG